MLLNDFFSDSMWNDGVSRFSNNDDNDDDDVDDNDDENDFDFKNTKPQFSPEF